MKLIGRGAARRFFATEAAEKAVGGLRLSLTTPISAVYHNETINQVIFPATTGLMAVLEGHLPTIAQLKPGPVSIFREGSPDPERFYVSGGYAMVHADGNCSLNCVEAIPIADLDVDAVRAGLTKAEEELKSANTDRTKAIAQIAIDVHQSMLYELQ